MHKDILQVFFPGQDSKEARLIDAKLKRLKMVGEGEAALQVSVFKSNSSTAEAFGFILQVATYGVGGWLAPHFDTYRLPGEEVRHGRWNHHHRHHNHPDHQPPSEAR